MKGQKSSTTLARAAPIRLQKPHLRVYSCCLHYILKCEIQSFSEGESLLFWHSRKPADAWLDIAPRLKNLGLKVIALNMTEDELSFDILDRSDPNRSYVIQWSRKNPQSDLIRDLNWAMGELHVNVKWKHV